MKTISSKEEQLRSRVYVLETLLTEIFGHMRTMVCCGYGDWVEKICKEIEGALENGKE